MNSRVIIAVGWLRPATLADSPLRSSMIAANSGDGRRFRGPIAECIGNLVLQANWILAGGHGDEFMPSDDLRDVPRSARAPK